MAGRRFDKAFKIVTVKLVVEAGLSLSIVSQVNMMNTDKVHFLDTESHFIFISTKAKKKVPEIVDNV